MRGEERTVGGPAVHRFESFAALIPTVAFPTSEPSARARGDEQKGKGEAQKHVWASCVDIYIYIYSRRNYGKVCSYLVSAEAEEKEAAVRLGIMLRFEKVVHNRPQLSLLWASTPTWLWLFMDELILELMSETLFRVGSTAGWSGLLK
eukprot:gene13485-9292_t